ncbi:hypothetical protein HK405_013229, partial [Cladochytrium tenue]
MASLLQHPGWMNVLALSLDSPSLPARTSVVEFFLALATVSYPLGHNLVLRTFEALRDTAGEDRAFAGFVRSVYDVADGRGFFGSATAAAGHRKDAVAAAHGVWDAGGDAQTMPRDVREFLISSLALVRYLVELPEQTDYRIELRNRFMASGFSFVLQRLRSLSPREFADILAHVDAFEERARADCDEFVEGLAAGLCGFDMNDSGQVVSALFESFADDANGASMLRSIFQHLLIPARLSAGPVRTKLLFFIDRIISQIVLDRKGLEVDFVATYQVPVDDILLGLVELDRLDATRKELLKTGQRLAELAAEKRRIERNHAALLERTAGLENQLTQRTAELESSRVLFDQYRARQDSIFDELSQ